MSDILEPSCPLVPSLGGHCSPPAPGFLLVFLLGYLHSLLFVTFSWEIEIRTIAHRAHVWSAASVSAASSPSRMSSVSLGSLPCCDLAHTLDHTCHSTWLPWTWVRALSFPAIRAALQPCSQAALPPHGAAVSAPPWLAGGRVWPPCLPFGSGGLVRSLVQFLSASLVR